MRLTNKLPSLWCRALVLAGLAIGSVTLTGCSTRSLQRAPVEDRGSVPKATRPAPPRILPGAENAGKPGYYTVKAGDNVFRISQAHGQSVADVARWNNLEDPYIIEIGQVLRVAAPGSNFPPPVASTRPVPAPGSARPEPAGASKPTAVVPPKPVAAEDTVNWAWPASGPILQGFDETKNKGLDIAGKAGDPVLAAADGSVVYAGSGLRGYGNLIILKHNNTFLTAYAHNQAILVKEKEKVKRGQRIAEMGQTDTERVKLHFEVRKSGKPVDPMRYMPPR